MILPQSLAAWILKKAAVFFVITAILVTSSLGDKQIVQASKQSNPEGGSAADFYMFKDLNPGQSGSGPVSFLSIKESYIFLPPEATAGTNYG